MSWLFAPRLRSFVALAALASFILNIAMLMPASYMMQVFDRVFSSRSIETPVMLGLITRMDLSGRGFSFDWLMAHTTDVDGNTIIDLGDQHITLNGLSNSALHQEDFMV